MQILSDYEWLFHPIFLSLKTLACTLFLLIFIGIALAYFLAFYNGKIKAFIDAIVMFPLIFPPIATGFILLYLLGRNGLIGSVLNLQVVFSFSALVIAAFFSALPIFVKPIEAALKSLPKSLSEAGASLNKNKFQIAIFVLLPSVKKTIVSALILALSRALGEVGITLMLGGNIVGKTDTISLAIYNAVFEGQNERAMIFSAILICVSLIFFILINILERAKNQNK